MVARPQGLDIACTLTLLQEEALDQGCRKDFKCSEASPFTRTATIKGALLLPLPPRQLPALLEAAIDKRLTQGSRLLHSLWAPGYRCAPEPQVHALQEVWAMCSEA
jgi:hypothetical protein